MFIPQMPWYQKVRDILVPTEKAANLVLITIILIAIFVLLRGGPVEKAALAVWLVLP